MRKELLIFFLALSFAGSASAQWKHSTSSDEMTGEITGLAHSPFRNPTSAMGFPYSDTQGLLGFGCDGKEEWAAFMFTNVPNLNRTTTANGYNIIKTRVKWDNDIETTRLIQVWGSTALRFESGKEAIGKIETAGTVLLELNWHGEGITYFRFSLSGSSAAIERARTFCRR